MRGISVIRKTAIFAFGLASAAIVSGCGQLNGRTGVVSSSMSGLQNTTLNGGPVNATQTGKYQCPTSVASQIKPINYASYTAGNFQVCTDSASLYDIELIGNEGSDQICVFPTNIGNSGSGSRFVFWQPDVNTGAPLYSCQALGGNSSLIFTFQGVTWNGAYIVAGKNAAAMQACMIYGAGTSVCPSFPSYSYGTFR